MTVTVDGDEVHVRGRTQRRLIAALAVAGTSGAGPSIAALVEMVYGDHPPPRPKRSLATLIWRLRNRWGPEAIASDRYHYRLAEQHCVVDATAFEQDAYRGRERARHGDSEGAIASLTSALSRWRSTAPDEVTVLPPDRTRLLELRYGVAERLADLLAEREEHHAAIDHLVEVVAARPDWEHSQARLIRCYAALGDASAALHALDVARRALIDQGVEPGPELAEAAGVIIPDGAVPLGHAAAPHRAAPHRAAPRRAAARPDATAPHPKLTPTHGPGGSPPGPASGGGPADEMIGRASTLARIVRAASAAIDQRRPIAVLIRGEAGIGKSTLLGAALREIAGRTPARVVRLDCDRRSTLPYGPLSALAGSLAGPACRRLADLLDPAPGSAVVDDAGQVSRALAADLTDVAAPDGLTLAVEDLHWAPVETEQAMVSAWRSCGRTPLVVLATTRDRVRTDGLAAIVDLSVELAGLTVAEIARMTGTGPESERARTLHRITGGNPLYVRHLERGGGPAVERVPGDLAAAIDAHLAQVPRDVLDALKVAASVGDRFDLLTLAALPGSLRRNPAEWQEHLIAAIRHGLVRADVSGEHVSSGQVTGDRRSVDAATDDRTAPDDPELLRSRGHFQFVHAVVAQHLYRQLTPPERVTVHAGISRALERISIGRPRPADLLAYHYTRGWPELPTDAVVDKLVAAAQAVGAQLDFRQAADYYRSALDHVAMDPGAISDERTADILGAAAGATAAAGDLEGSNELYASQQALSRKAGLTRTRVFASLGALRTHYLTRSRPQVADELADALREASRDEKLDDYRDLAGDALAAVAVYRPARARELLQLLASRGPAVSGAMRLSVWEHMTVADQLASARAMVQDPDVAPIAAWLRLWVSEVAAGLRSFDDAPDSTAAISSADDQTAFDLMQWRVTREIATGRLARARTLIKGALAGPRHPDPAERARRAASFYGQQLLLALITEDRAAVERSPVTANPTWVSRHPVMRYIHAYLCGRSGEVLQARGLCEELLDEVADGDIPTSDVVPRLLLLIDACVHIQHADGVRACLGHLGAHRGEHGIFRFGQYWGIVDQSIGDGYLMLGETDPAVGEYRAALAGLERVGARVRVPAARRALASALSIRGRAADAGEVRHLVSCADAEDRALGLRHRISDRDHLTSPRDRVSSGER